MYIISRCLLGTNCKYNGGNNYNEAVINFCEKYSCVSVCPEVEGGLTTPRSPSEIQSGELLILSKEGKDMTSNFVEGARLSLELALKEANKKGEKLEGAILKAKSPSCGKGKIYDGSFSGTLVEGDGIFVRLLKEFAKDHGLEDFKILTEKDLADF